MKSLKQFKAYAWKDKKRVLIRYTLFQLPETGIIIIILLILDRWINIPPWFVLSFTVLWILKDIIAFPFVWHAYIDPVADSRYPQVGEEGIVMEKCASRGYVIIQGEYWEAEPVEKGVCLNKGERVVVAGRKGLVLMIRAKEN